MNEEFVRGNISAALDLAINYGGSFGKKVRFIKLSNGAIASKAVIQSYDKGDFVVDIYGDLIPGMECMKRDGIAPIAVRYTIDRNQLINFIIENELILNISEEV